MSPEERLVRHLEHCERIVDRMKRNGTWPWRRTTDSPNAEDLVESDDQPNVV